MDENLLEQATQELEKSIAEDHKALDPQSLKDAIVQGVKELLAKGKGAPETDKSAEKDKRGTLIDTKEDPAKTPKKSGDGYPDSTQYTAQKGEDMDDEDESDEDDAPSFFKKKGKKKSSKKCSVKKGYGYDEEEAEEGEEAEAFDATDFVEELGSAVDHLGKSVARIEEGVAIFGELLTEMADPRREKLLVNMAKALTHMIEEQKEIKKSLSAHSNLMKSIATLPGAPRVAGLHAMVEQAEVEEGERVEISKADKDRLFQAAVKKQISYEEMNKALKTGDLAVLSKVK